MPGGATQDTGHGGEVWQNVVHWSREWQTTSVFLSWEPHEQYEKAFDKDFIKSVVHFCKVVILTTLSFSTHENKMSLTYLEFLKFS